MEEFIVVIIILGIVALGLWVYAIADIVRGTFSGSSSKMLWLIVVIFFPIVGALLYLLVGRGAQV